MEFPFPQAEHRLRLWELLLPAEAPPRRRRRARLLPERFELSGGRIRNAAIAAAVLAAEAGVAIGMEQLVRGVAMDYVNAAAHAGHGRRQADPGGGLRRFSRTRCVTL